MKGLEKYDAKILIAWGEAISGNMEIREWLLKNGYHELGIFCYALNNHAPSRKWLMEHKYAHLMAVINGIERNETALNWLGVNGYYILRNIALAADGFETSLEWLKLRHPGFAVLASKMSYIKTKIDDKNFDPHRINP